MTKVKIRKSNPFLIAVALFLISQSVLAQADKLKEVPAGGKGSFVIKDYRKQLNPEFNREARQSTRFIIVHTSEAGLASTLRTLSGGKKISKYHGTKGGHAHYVIARNGQVYRILDHGYRADHAGLSMWNGVEDISSHSLGIELVGYHYDEITAEQYRSLSWLIKELQKIYNIPDKNVLAHSQVSYGEKNLWFNKAHRGRKRCALNFDRRRVGLTDAWTGDPDVRSGRLLGDRQITRIFYKGFRAYTSTQPAAELSNIISASNTAWNIAGEDYNSPETVYILPGKDKQTVRGDRLGELVGWSRVPTGTQVLVNQPLDREKQEGPIFTITRDYTAWSFAGSAYRKPSTIYFLPGDKIVPGNQIKDWDALPTGTRLIIDYQGPTLIQAIEGQTPWGIAKKAYNHKETIYLVPGKSLVTGDRVEDFNNLPRGTKIFIKIAGI